MNQEFNPQEEVKRLREAGLLPKEEKKPLPAKDVKKELEELRRRYGRPY